MTMKMRISEVNVTQTGELVPKGHRRAAAHAAGRKYIQQIRQHIRHNDWGPRSRGGRGGKYGDQKRYNREYARREGKPRTPIDFHRDGSMLRNMRHGVKFTSDGFEVGIIFDTPHSQRMYEYHNEMGAGRNRIIRQFVYANSGDISAIKKAISNELKKRNAI